MPRNVTPLFIFKAFLTGKRNYISKKNIIFAKKY
jgi:hypothetical protein